MQTIRIFDRNFELFVTQQEVEQAIASVAEHLNADYAQCNEPPILLVTLSGAMMFAGQLAKHLTFDGWWAFVKCASYGAQLSSSGNVQMVIEPTINVAGRDVIVLEDVVDSGHTWLFLHDYLIKQGAKSTRIATMTLKPEAYTGNLPIDYTALSVDNLFIIGYGLDYNQRGRNLPGIYKLSE